MSPRVRLFCLPYAGAGASAYRRWRTAFGTAIEVRPLTLPGRESRMSERPVVDPAEIAQAIAAQADLPYAIYGHSMGARLGFEVLRLLRDRGAPLPIRFFAAAARPPDVRGDGLFDNVAGLPQPELVEVIRAGGGVPEEVLAEPELLALVLPTLRVDLAWLDQYAYTPGEPLPVPIVTFAGSTDAVVSPDEVAGWARHTSAGWRGFELPGGHFFLHSHLPEVVRRIRAELLPAPSHRVPLGETGWWVWKDAILRGTGFPADGLAAFRAPHAAMAADAYLADPSTDAFSDTFDDAFAVAVAAGAATARGIAADPLFREAITWQNSNVLAALDHLAAAPADEKRNSKRFERETVLLRYWQRYCGKNDTIGFFGPCCWVRVEPESPAAVVVKPGAGLIRARRVGLEFWAVAAYAARLAADPLVRRWLPATLQPHLTLEGRTLHQPALPPIALSAAEAVAVRLANGARAHEVVAALGGEIDLHEQEDGYLLLARLAERGVLIWGVDLAVNAAAESALRQCLQGIGDIAVRETCLAGLDRLAAAREAVAAAAGDPDALRIALSTLDAVFTELTGLAPRHREGETYAARALCYEDAERDLDVVFGAALLDELAGPLSILLQAARWLTVALAKAYSEALHELYADLASGGDAPVLLADLWYFAQGSLWGAGERPVDAVAAQFAARWSTLFGLGDEPVMLRSADLVDRVREAFPAERPGWSAGVLHSPDLHVCARDADALARGEFTIVLGELHTSWPTFDCGVFTQWHPDPAQLIDAMAKDLGPQRIQPLYPADWPRHSARLNHSLPGPTDRFLAFAAAPGAPRDRLLPATSVIVRERDGELIAVAPDGHTWPLLEMFSALLSMHAVDGFKLVEAAPHTPRVTLDRLVVSRETWRTTVGETGLLGVLAERERYLAMRRWRQRLGLPERVFVKIGTEVKPFFADLTSPQHAKSLCQAMRTAHSDSGPGVSVVVTEMLPDIQDAWVPDASGKRYFSELRLHVVDGEAAHA